jgi:hypothetical protein
MRPLPTQAQLHGRPEPGIGEFTRAVVLHDLVSGGAANVSGVSLVAHALRQSSEDNEESRPASEVMDDAYWENITKSSDEE